jgi:hypothetical protein
VAPFRANEKIVEYALDSAGIGLGKPES